MELNSGQLMDLCEQITVSLGLDKKNWHIAALFEDNDHDDIIGWAVLDENNNFISEFAGPGSIKALYEKYDGIL